MGDAKAPVTIIEYASMTCPHCAHFQETTFPELKKRYIDTGKVRYIFREFPLDNLAAAAFMLARCAGKDDIDKYYRDDRHAVPPAAHLGGRKAAPAADGDRQAGRLHRSRVSTPASRIRRCSTASKACASAPSTSSRSKSTPTFFINGKRYRRRLDRGDGQGDRPLSQGRIRVFRPGAGARKARIFALGGPKGLENRAC